MKRELGVWLGLALVVVLIATVVLRLTPDVPVSTEPTSVAIREFYTLGPGSDTMQLRAATLLMAGLSRERNLVVRRTRRFIRGATVVNGAVTLTADSVRIDISHSSGPNFEEGDTTIRGHDLVIALDSATSWLLREMRFTIRPEPLVAFLVRRDSLRARWQRDPRNVSLAESLVTVHGNESFAHLAYARALTADRQYREAIIHLRRAQDRGIDHGDMVTQIARTYQQADSGDAALRVLREWVRDGPDKPRAWAVYAEMLRALGYEQEARQADAEARRLESPN